MKKSGPAGRSFVGGMFQIVALTPFTRRSGSSPTPSALHCARREDGHPLGTAVG